MPRRSVATMPYNPSPQDNFFVIGSDDQNYKLFSTRIIDLITQRYNPNSGWQNYDGSAGDLQAELNSRYYVEADANLFSFILPDGVFGDTFTLYSETPNVFVRNSNLNVITDVIPLSVLHLLYNGVSWVNFSSQAASAGGLLTSRGIVTSSGFTTFAQGRLVGIEINRTIATGNQFIRYLPGRNMNLGIVRANIVTRPSPRKANGRFVNLWIHRGVITARHGQSYQQGTLQDINYNRGTI